MTFTGADLAALAPLIVVAAAAIVVMLLAAFAPLRHGVAAGATVVGLALALLVLPAAWDAAPRQVTPLLLVDRAAVFYCGLLLATTLGVVGLAAARPPIDGAERGELYVLILASALGAITLAVSAHFAALFIGFELLSVALVAMIAYECRSRLGLEAALKYLILSGVASALLLFGIALLYAEMGTLEFASLAARLGVDGTTARSLIAPGLALIVAGFAFKLSLVPFHLWTPDVYHGAPAPVTAYLATVSKGAVFIVLLRYFVTADAFGLAPVVWALSLLAGGSILIGNVLALLERNVKRILAYSSIAHIGYLMAAFIGGGADTEAASYYLAAYFASNLGAFGVVALLATSDGELQSIADYRGLFWRHPWLAGVLSLMLLSLAGIPLTMGFVAKFYIIAASVQGSLWVLLALIIVGSAIGLYYYLRVLVTMYRDPEPAAATRWPDALPFAGRAVLAAAVVAVVVLGVFPRPVIELVRSAAPVVGVAAR